MGPAWHIPTQRSTMLDAGETGAFSEPLLRTMLAWLRWPLLAAIFALSLLAPTAGRFGFTATDLILAFAAYSALAAVFQRRIGWLAFPLSALALDAAVVLTLIGLCGSVQCPLYFLSPLLIVPALLFLSAPAALMALLGIGASITALTVTQPDWDGTTVALQLVVFENGLLLAFAAPVALLARSIRSKQQEVEHQRKRMERLRLLNEVLATAGAALDQERISRTVAELAKQALGGDLGLVALLQEDGNLEAIWTTLPADPHLLERTDLSVVRAVGTGRAPLVVRDTQAGPGYGLYEALGVRSCVAVPLHVADMAVGVALVGSRAPGVYREEAQDWLGTIAQQAALSLAHARLYSRARADAARLAALDRTKSDFLFTASHELRTPLAALKIAAGLLQEPRVRDAATHDVLLTGLSRNVERLEKLIDDILDMARLQTGSLRLDWVLLAPRQLVQDAATAVRPLLEERGQRLVVRCGPDLPRVWGDRRRIDQVLVNLLTNAQKYGGANSVIELAAEARPEGLLLWVRDEGPGIPPECQQQIFEPFQRLAGSGDAQRGIGLGLAISKALVALHGGRIWVERAPGRGSVFSVLLPRPDHTDEVIPDAHSGSGR